MDYVPALEQAEQEAEDAEMVDISDTFEYRLDRRIRDAAVAWAREHPGEVLRLAAQEQ